MYVPRVNVLDDESELRAFVAAGGAAELITIGADGYPLATLLPIVWEGDRVIAHFARANPHWEQIGQDAPVLLVSRGAQAYVSPSWYAAKAEHGRVVPTWNYSAVQLRGRARVVEDLDWLRDAVADLTGRHESGRAEPWTLQEAPEAFIDGQLRGIVGVEIRVEEVIGKAKLSQNRSAADRAGVIAGLGAEPAPEAAIVAAQMRAREESASR